MKLRNKKTGKVQTCDFAVISDDFRRDGELCKLESHIFIFRSIKQLNEEYEDYTPKEPLIKDEKIRKAVRAWAEACDVERCHYEGDGDFATRWHGIKLDCSQIELDEGFYTIAELCGEGEE